MLHQLVRFFRPSPQTQYAYALYAKINEEARRVDFFEKMGAPDTLDGRFELILLHMFLYLHALKKRDADTQELQRLLIEAFFEDMDRSVREMGIGDTGVGRRVKAMANAFYGRINAFEKAINDAEELQNALLKNTFATCEVKPNDSMLLLWVAYIQNRLQDLLAQPIENPDFLTK
jgi:cytochrome b pre-mRNA-processing protein 3